MADDVKTRPIIFNPKMVLAILSGRKTQTRRPVKFKGAAKDIHPTGMKRLSDGSYQPFKYNRYGEVCVLGASMNPPLGTVGDKLWVKETFCIAPVTAWNLPKMADPDSPDFSAYYRAGFDRAYSGRWTPSIHMPRWASRITLTITGVRAERLQHMSDLDLEHELGVPEFSNPKVSDFIELWDSIYEKQGLGWNERGLSWKANPFVWVYDFDTRVFPFRLPAIN